MTGREEVRGREGEGGSLGERAFLSESRDLSPETRFEKLCDGAEKKVVSQKKKNRVATRQNYYY